MGRADELRQRLERSCSSQMGRAVRVDGLHRFSGGASRETWSFTADGERLVLRLDPPGLPRRPDVVSEVDLLREAHRARVPVPEVMWQVDEDTFGSSGFVMRHVEGETIPRKILREDAFREARRRFASRCGEIAARIHAIPADAVPGLHAPPSSPAEAACDQYTDLLDTFGEPHPAFEVALRWLRSRIPSARRLSVVHGDLRIGNLIVGHDDVRAVLDWELAHLGDPCEDLAWLCTRAWRFGGRGEVGGIGDREDLYAAYERTSGSEVDREAVHWWEVMSSVKWGVITIGQAFAHLSGHVRSLELAAIGRRTVETEYDVLRLIGAA